MAMISGLAAVAASVPGLAASNCVPCGDGARRCSPSHWPMAMYPSGAAARSSRASCQRSVPGLMTDHDVATSCPSEAGRRCRVAVPGAAPRAMKTISGCIRLPPLQDRGDLVEMRDASEKLSMADRLRERSAGHENRGHSGGQRAEDVLVQGVADED